MVLRSKASVDATQLSIDLEAGVGEYLSGGADYNLGLDALYGDSQNIVTHPLDLCIHWGLAIVEHGLDIAGIVDVLAETGLPDNPHPKSIRGLDEVVSKVLEVLRLGRLLGCEAGDGPVLDGGALVVLRWQSDPQVIPSSLLQCRELQDPTRSVHHLLRHIQAKLLNVGVIVEVSLADQVPDLPLPVQGGPGSGFDHG